MCPDCARRRPPGTRLPLNTGLGVDPMPRLDHTGPLK